MTQLTAGDLVPAPAVEDGAFHGRKIPESGVKPRHQQGASFHGDSFLPASVPGEGYASHSVTTRDPADHSVESDHGTDAMFDTRHFGRGAARGRNFGAHEIGSIHLVPQSVKGYHFATEVLDPYKIQRTSLYDGHFRVFSHTKVRFYGQAIAPGGFAGQVLTHTAAGQAWRDPLTARWENVSSTVTGTQGQVNLPAGRTLPDYSAFYFYFFPLGTFQGLIPTRSLTQHSFFRPMLIGEVFWLYPTNNSTIEYQVAPAYDGDRANTTFGVAPVFATRG